MLDRIAVPNFLAAYRIRRMIEIVLKGER